MEGTVLSKCKAMFADTVSDLDSSKASDHFQRTEQKATQQSIPPFLMATPITPPHHVLYSQHNTSLRGLVQTICGNHNVIVTLSFNPLSSLHNITVSWYKNNSDNLHWCMHVCSTLKSILSSLHGNLDTKRTHLQCVSWVANWSTVLMNSTETLSALNPCFSDVLLDFYSKYDRPFNARSLLCWLSEN